MEPDWIVPDWPAPARVRAFVTSRNGGVSEAPYAGLRGGGLNLAAHVGDTVWAVEANRARLARDLPAAPCWLSQVHGTRVADADRDASLGLAADAATARCAERVCAVLVADCMPVFFCDRKGEAVAVAHAGWRGLLAGVLESTVAALRIDAADLMAYLGPAIGPDAFEVGQDVFDGFTRRDATAQEAFRAGRPGKWYADLEALARQRLARLGVTGVYGGGRCTVTEEDTYFSYRRDGVTGRMAALIWLGEGSRP